MSETVGTETVVKTRKPKREGPKCPACGKPQNISGVPADPEKLAKLKARAAKLAAKVALADGITVK